MWGIKFNISKSNVIHHRPKSIDRTEFVFSLSQSNITCISQCTYLGIVMDEFLDFISCTDTLAHSGTRALGAIINKHKQNSLGYKTFTKLFEACVLPVISWGSPI